MCVVTWLVEDRAASGTVSEYGAYVVGCACSVLPIPHYSWWLGGSTAAPPSKPIVCCCYPPHDRDGCFLRLFVWVPTVKCYRRTGEPYKNNRRTTVGDRGSRRNMVPNSVFSNERTVTCRSTQPWLFARLCVLILVRSRSKCQRQRPNE